MSLETTIDRIRAFAQAKGWRPSRLAREAELHANTLRDFAKAEWNPSLETLRKLEAIVPAGFGPEDLDGKGASPSFGAMTEPRRHSRPCARQAWCRPAVGGAGASSA